MHENHAASNDHIRVSYEGVEDFTAPPDIATAIPPLASIAKDVELQEWSGSVNHLYKRYVLRIPDLQSDKQEICFDIIEPPVDEISRNPAYKLRNQTIKPCVDEITKEPKSRL